MKKKKKSKKNILIPILLVVVILIVLFCYLFYKSYMDRVDATFSNVKDTVKSSTILKENYGEIKEVKYDNFMKWLNKEENYECLSMILVTTKGNYNICTKVRYEESLNMYIVDGFVIDGKLLND